MLDHKPCSCCGNTQLAGTALTERPRGSMRIQQVQRQHTRSDHTDEAPVLQSHSSIIMQMLLLIANGSQSRLSGSTSSVLINPDTEWRWRWLWHHVRRWFGLCRHRMLVLVRHVGTGQHWRVC